MVSTIEVFPRRHSSYFLPERIVVSGFSMTSQDGGYARTLVWVNVIGTGRKNPKFVDERYACYLWIYLKLLSR